MALDIERSTTVEPAPASRRSRALWLLFAEENSAQRAAQVAAALAAAEQGRLSFDGLFEARRNDRLVGAAWTQATPGRMAVVWGAQLAGGEPESTALQLHAAIDDYCRRHEVCFAQALLPLSATLVESRLRASGYCHAAEIRYLACSLDDERPDEPTAAFDDCEKLAPPSTALRFEAYNVDNHDRLAAIVERTYEQTLDCPDLNSVRETSDVLEGYRACGSFAPERWMIVQQDGRDVGCLLLADYPEQDQWELVYMGLLPEARGRRLGLAITRHAQSMARRARRGRLVLAVDSANAPALAMYRAAGLAAWDERRVFLKIFRPDSRT